MAEQPEPEPEARTEGELWAQAAGMFNDPEVSATKAIEFMEEHDFVEPTPAGVARLFREKAGTARKGGLDRREIGEYLAKLKPYNNEVRQAYVETFDFTGKTFVAALREFLNSFRLPGESMLIERLFSAWAARFYRNNPGEFAKSLLTEDKVALIREAFDKYAKAAESGDESPEPGGKKKKKKKKKTMGEIIHTGWMNKKGENNNRFKRRWFEIQRLGDYDRLTYMEKEGGKPKGTINLSTCDGAVPSMESALRFTLVGRKEDGSEREYVFDCDDEEACMTWVNMVTRSLSQHLYQKAEEAKDRFRGTGSVKHSDIFEMVRSLSLPDFKYMKDPDIEQMQDITEKEMRYVAPALGMEVSFKDAREMVARAQSGREDEPIDFLTFLTMVAFKLGFDCAFVLAYTTLMLNTDQHNDKLKGQKRLTCPQFIENNRRSPDLATITDEFFEQLYHEIAKNEIKMEGEEEEQEEPQQQETAAAPKEQQATPAVATTDDAAETPAGAGDEGSAETETADGAAAEAEPAEAADTDLTPEESARLALWKEGAAMFNDPEISATRAIEFMEENDLVEPNAAGVARLFREKAGPPSQGGLDKKEIGEFLSKLKPYNNDVRQAYVETFDFTGKSFVDALREFLNSFRLPGESMLIERLFSTWAARFYRNNPGDFAPALLPRAKVEKFGSAFDAFAKAHPSSDRWSASAWAGDEADGAAVAAAGELIHSGWMTKKGEKNNSFKKRWFEVKRFENRDEMSYAEKEGGKPKGTINLSTCDGAVPSMEDTLLFTVASKKPDGSEREYVLRCEDEESAMIWVNTITKSVAQAAARKAEAANRRLSKIGTIKCSDLFEMVRSLGGDFKYMKDPDLELMQQITEKELRFVAPVLETELNFKEARRMAKRATSGQGSIDFTTFLTMVVFKLGFDCVFVLAYATLMLNTDAHNEKLKGQKRLTCAQFIENNRRSPDLASIPDSYLERLYKEIVENEIKMEGEGEEDAEVEGEFDRTLRESMAVGSGSSPGSRKVAAAKAAVASLPVGDGTDAWDALGIPGGGSEGAPAVAAAPAPAPAPAPAAVAEAGEGGEGDEDSGLTKLEKLVKAQSQGALPMDTFQRLVAKAVAELESSHETLRKKLEKLNKAMEADALTPDMYTKMLGKHIKSAADEMAAAAEQEKLMAMFAAHQQRTAPAAEPAVEEGVPPASASEPAAEAEAEPQAEPEAEPEAKASA